MVNQMKISLDVRSVPKKGRDGGRNYVGTCVSATTSSSG